ncbi:T9SS-dependent choice-of-anchor J family protein [Flavobacterium dankookense]|uniref:Putative secreted protein (Por secretion system target) n=1 Tax=Flavobacterium dankookense TaxID=706186 RepID=A0A4R6Q964_9FLAO|nr:T9SS type A sorting domain-containing protein [Flavobacterium dankookense]TDP58690.1 putative secreted protein (Por secretion system target) [Flavobacterium dankookense]
MKKQLLLFVLLCLSFVSHAQFFEGFENTIGPNALPSTIWPLNSGDWTVFNTPTDNPQRWSITTINESPDYVYGGENAAFCNRSNFAANEIIENYLVTPVITVPNDPILSFYTRTFQLGNQGTKFQIKVAPATANPTDPNSYVLLQEWDETTLSDEYFSNYVPKNVTLDEVVGLDIYIAFVMKRDPVAGNFMSDRWLIDNVGINSNAAIYHPNNCDEKFILKAFLDTNGNSIKDDGEPKFIYGTYIYQINNSTTSLFGYTTTDDFIICNSNSLNTFDISYQVFDNLNTLYSCNVNYSDVSIQNDDGIATLYFPVNVINAQNNVSINLYTNQNPRAASNYTINLTYKNKSNTTASGKITFTKDNLVTINSISQTGTLNSTDGFTFDYINLEPFETRHISVILSVPNIPTVELGDYLTHSATITVDNDVDLNDNSSSITNMVVAAYDPNDKMESHGEKIVFDTFTDDYLIYTIRFENTGNANAEFIRIEDTLNTQLDENTFEFISSSHEVNVLKNASKLTFYFSDVNLPPSIPDTDIGKGYLQFKIKPKPGFAVGDIIPNTAEIYFDYNPAIITNTFNTVFVETLNSNSFSKQNILIYPNPATSNVNIELNSSDENIHSIQVVDMLGKIVLNQQNITSNNITINTSLLSKGIYLIKINSENNNYLVEKLIIK